MATIQRASRQQTATTLELFFDLVFVFALTQVTALMAHDLSPQAIVNGMLILGLLWWGWVCYAWVGNVTRADEGLVRLAMLAAMAVMFVAALAIPQAFHDEPGNVHGPLVIAGCYFVFRVIHLVIMWLASEDDAGLRSQLFRFAPTILGSSSLLVVAAFQEGWTQTALWAAALAADYVGNLLGGADGWRLPAPGHFAERHGLILIVALGESIVAMGIGIGDYPLTWPVVAAAVTGLAVTSGLWWLYFDLSALHGEHALASCEPEERAAMARDAYSYLHLPILAGVILLALGFKKALEYVSDTSHHGIADPLTGEAMHALFLGVVLYLLGHVAFKLRTVRTVSVPRLVLVGAILALWVLAPQVPAVGQLVGIAVLVWGLVVFETVRYAEIRDAVRHGHGAGGSAS
jgi:low temperature requirement protein LtrA